MRVKTFWNSGLILMTIEKRGKRLCCLTSIRLKSCVGWTRIYTGDAFATGIFSSTSRFIIDLENVMIFRRISLCMAGLQTSLRK